MHQRGAIAVDCRLTTLNPEFPVNRIIHLGLLRKNPFGPPRLRAGFPFNSSGLLAASDARGAYDLDPGR
jgi:hypothetical protein